MIGGAARRGGWPEHGLKRKDTCDDRHDAEDERKLNGAPAVPRCIFSIADVRQRGDDLRRGGAEDVRGGGFFDAGLARGDLSDAEARAAGASVGGEAINDATEALHGDIVLRCEGDEARAALLVPAAAADENGEDVSIEGSQTDGRRGALPCGCLRAR